MGSYYFVHSMDWNRSPGFRARFLGVSGTPDNKTGKSEFAERFADSGDQHAIDQAGRFFHDIRRTGELAMQLNNPGINDIEWN